jgi:hypothetical protein
MMILLSVGYYSGNIGVYNFVENLKVTGFTPCYPDQSINEARNGTGYRASK